MALRYSLLTLALVVLAACGTSDSALRESGRSEAYITGFHDGRHSGMQEAGNNYEHFMQDTQRFATDADYKAGWLAGEAEGKRLQEQAVSVGNAAAGAYGSYQIGKEVDKQDPDKVAKDAVKGVDTKALKSLEEE